MSLASEELDLTALKLCQAIAQDGKLAGEAWAFADKDAEDIRTLAQLDRLADESWDEYRRGHSEAMRPVLSSKMSFRHAYLAGFDEAYRELHIVVNPRAAWKDASGATHQVNV